MKDSWIGQVGAWGQRHYQYLKENKPTVAEVEAFSYGFRLGIRLMIEAGVPLAKGIL